jgi:tRNA pseudouridine55 synthase
MSFLFLNKPRNWTSHDVVAVVRRATGEKRVGHAGTLDPFATGLLVVGVGRAFTRLLDTFKAHEKEYVVVAQLGATSTTQDCTGTITPTINAPEITRDMIISCLPTFMGTIDQVPPMFSAKKVNGQKLYDLAREGKTIDRKPAQITIYSLELIAFEDKCATLRVVCSTGTYIRTLVHDLGARLGCGAYALELTRTRIGMHTLADAQDIDTFCALSRNEKSALHRLPV